MHTHLIWQGFLDNFDEWESKSMKKAELERMARERRVPEHLIEGLVAYAVDHRPTGGFLQAVLANDLHLTLQRADSSSLASLTPLVAFIHHYLPSGCYGSKAAVHEWLNGKSLEV